jgi:hypothetical protein
MSSANQTQAKLDPLEVKHRAERLSRDYNLELNAEYFATIHNRSLARVYDAWSGKAPGLLSKMNKHLDVIEQRKSQAQS